MGVEDVAEFLNLDPATVRALARRGDLPGVKLGKHWRFLRVEVLASLKPHPSTQRAAPVVAPSLDHMGDTISQEEAAAILRVSVRTIHRMITRGQLEKIPSATGVARLSRSQIQAYGGGPRTTSANDER